MIRILTIILILAAAVAKLTLPTKADAEAALRNHVITTILSTNLQGRDVLERAVISVCRATPAQCYDALRPALTLTFEPRLIYARVSADALGRQVTC